MWTRRSASRCGWSFPSCSRPSAPPCCAWRRTPGKRWPWATASACWWTGASRRSTRPPGCTAIRKAARWRACLATRRSTCSRSRRSAAPAGRCRCRSAARRWCCPTPAPGCRGAPACSACALKTCCFPPKRSGARCLWPGRRRCRSTCAPWRCSRPAMAPNCWPAGPKTRCWPRGASAWAALPRWCRAAACSSTAPAAPASEPGVAMASLSLQDVSKIYTRKGRADNWAVKSVSMAIDDGEIIALLGSSGCGKTSTLRMIAGFESVSQGSIRIGDKTVNALAPAERNVAMAFEGYALYPPLTVYDNIAFGLLRGKVARDEVRRRVRHVAELLEIADILERYPPMLSGGQQQRVSLARALVRPADRLEPPNTPGPSPPMLPGAQKQRVSLARALVRPAALYLLDEPMSQLEPQLRSLLRGRIKDYLIAHRMTSVFVTHDQTEAVALADRIAVMSDGVLQQFASPEALKERPANLFVAGFIGEPAMNLLPAVVAHRAGRLEGLLRRPQTHAPPKARRARPPTWCAPGLSGGRAMTLLPAVVAHRAGRLEVLLGGRQGHAALRVGFGPAARIAAAAGLQDGQAVQLGVRPHKVRLDTQPPGGDRPAAGGNAQPAGDNIVQGPLAFNQWQGDQSHIGVELGGHTLLVVTDGALDLAPHSRVTLELPLAALHLFDSHTQRAVLHGADL